MMFRGMMAGMVCLAMSTWTAGGGAASAPSVGGTEYAIRFHRPVKVGDKFEYRASGTYKANRTNMMGEKSASSGTNFSGKLGGHLEATAVSETGQLLEAALAVAVCEMTRGEITSHPIPPGTVILARYASGHKEYRYKETGKLVPDEVRPLLEILFDMEHKGPTSDEIFGTDKPQKTGGQWAIHSDRAAESFVHAGATLRANDISGKVKLVGLKKVRGIDCLDLKVEIKTANNVAELPPGMRMESAIARTIISCALPLKESLPRVEMDITHTYLMRARGQAGPNQAEMQLDVSAATRVKYEMIPLDKVERPK